MAAARSSPFTTNPKAPSRNSDGDFVLRPHYGLRTPTVLGFLVGDFNICDPAEGSLNSRCRFSLVKTCVVTAPSTRYPALIAFSSISRWLRCVISSATPTRLVPLAINRYPAITSLSGSSSSALGSKQQDHPVMRRWLSNIFVRQCLG